MQVVVGGAAAGFVWGWLVSARLRPRDGAMRPPTLLAGVALFAMEAWTVGGRAVAAAVVATAAVAFLAHRRWLGSLARRRPLAKGLTR